MSRRMRRKRNDMIFMVLLLAAGILISCAMDHRNGSGTPVTMEQYVCVEAA